MANRILLIDPPLYKHPFWDPVRYAQPLGLWSIASHLADSGHDVQILSVPAEGWDHQRIVGPRDRTEDFAFYQRSKCVSLGTRSLDSTYDRYCRQKQGDYLYVGLPLDEVVQRVEAFRPDLIGISLIASCHHQSVVDLARGLRSAGCDVPIVVGGQHATAMPEVVLRDAAGVIDWLVRGEGEQVMAAIADAPRNDGAIRILPGVCYLDEQVRFQKNRRPAFFDLSDIALPKARFLNQIPMPTVPSHTLNSQGRRYVDAMFSVGCHNSCAYCYSPQMPGRLRKQGEEAVRTVLEDLWEQGFRELVLQDDDLLSDRQGFVRLLSLLREYGFVWQDNGGIELELLDGELVDAIIESGCTGLYIPVNPRQLADTFPKPDALLRTHMLRRLKEAGVYTYTS